MANLKLGSKGPLVEEWQNFIASDEDIDIEADGNFNKETRMATILWQMKNGLKPDGIVGTRTFAMARKQNMSVNPKKTQPKPKVKKSQQKIEKESSANPWWMTSNISEIQKESKVEELKLAYVKPTVDKSGSDWPPIPKLPLGSKNTQKLFGKIDFDVVKYYDERRKKTRLKAVMKGDFSKEITVLKIPQMVGKMCYGRPSNGKLRFNRRAAPQMKSLWAAWEAAGLLDLVLTWDGSYVFRLIRGSKTNLSNHSYGTAFDINVKWNGLGKRCPLVGQKGSVRELTPLANEYGFYWGGHYKRRKDGMHYECVKLFTKDQLKEMNKKNGFEIDL